MALPGAFIGREGELSRLLGAVGGDARLVLVTGDAGVGKTRLVAEVMTRAAAAGMVVVRGECLPLAVALPWQPIAEALGELARLDGGRLLETALGAVPAYVRTELGRLVPRLGPGAEAGAAGRDGEWRRERLFAGLAELLDAVPRRARLGLVVEDVHWADNETLDFLTFLARTGRGAVTVVATCRSDEEFPTSHERQVWHAGTVANRRGHRRVGRDHPPGSTYLPAFAEGVRAALRFLAPRLLGLDPTNVSGIRRTMDAVLMGHQYAKSAVDIACWDLRGKAAGLPITALLGGVLQKDFPIYEAVRLGSPESMASFAERRSVAGIKRFQLKVGNTPRDDAARTRAVVQAAADGTIIVADANGGWSLLDARIAMNSMADLPVFIEQPCRTTEDSMLASRDSKLPLVLDESIVTLSDVYEAKRSACVSSINIKISRVGGLTGAALMRDVMQELNLMVSVEDMWGGDLITAVVSHLAASTRPESLLMTSFMNDWTDGHIAGYRPRSVNGRGSAPAGPGLGIEVDTSLLGEPLFSVEA